MNPGRAACCLPSRRVLGRIRAVEQFKSSVGQSLCLRWSGYQVRSVMLKFSGVDVRT